MNKHVQQTTAKNLATIYSKSTTISEQRFYQILFQEVHVNQEFLPYQTCDGPNITQISTLFTFTNNIIAHIQSLLLMVPWGHTTSASCSFSVAATHFLLVFMLVRYHTHSVIFLKPIVSSRPLSSP